MPTMPVSKARQQWVQCVPYRCVPIVLGTSSSQQSIRQVLGIILLSEMFERWKNMPRVNTRLRWRVYTRLNGLWQMISFFKHICSCDFQIPKNTASLHNEPLCFAPNPLLLSNRAIVVKPQSPRGKINVLAMCYQKRNFPTHFSLLLSCCPHFCVCPALFMWEGRLDKYVGTVLDLRVQRETLPSGRAISAKRKWKEMGKLRWMI